MQHLLVITDPVCLSKLLLSILTGKVYDRQVEGEGDGCINSGIQPSTDLCQIVCARLWGYEVTLPTARMAVRAGVPWIWCTHFGIAVPWLAPCVGRSAQGWSTALCGKSIWEVQMFKGWLHPPCNQQSALKNDHILSWVRTGRRDLHKLAVWERVWSFPVQGLPTWFSH